MAILYRCFNKDNDLIYVGTTSKNKQEILNKISKKKWAKEVFKLVTEEMRQVEASYYRSKLIERHDPIRNRHNEGEEAFGLKEPNAKIKFKGYSKKPAITFKGAGEGFIIIK